MARRPGAHDPRSGRFTAVAAIAGAAKNHASVAVVTDPSAYPVLLAALDAGGFTLRQRRALAARAFADIAEYDVAVANWCAVQLGEDVEWPGGESGCGKSTLARLLMRLETPRRTASGTGAAARSHPAASISVRPR